LIRIVDFILVDVLEKIVKGDSYLQTRIVSVYAAVDEARPAVVAAIAAQVISSKTRSSSERFVDFDSMIRKRRRFRGDYSWFDGYIHVVPKREEEKYRVTTSDNNKALVGCKDDLRIVGGTVAEAA